MELAALKCFEIDGREVFRLANHEKIQLLAKSMQAANPGAKYQKAWAKKWNGLSDEERAALEEDAANQPCKWE
jgi:hypothetical protein